MISRRRRRFFFLKGKNYDLESTFWFDQLKVELIGYEEED